MGKKEGPTRWREQQVRKLVSLKAHVIIPLPLCFPPSPPLSQYIPLRAWLYRDGFARFSNTRFTLSSIDDQCILGLRPSTPHAPFPSCPLADGESSSIPQMCAERLLDARFWSGHRRNRPGPFPLELPVLWGWEAPVI